MKKILSLLFASLLVGVVYAFVQIIITAASSTTNSVMVTGMNTNGASGPYVLNVSSTVSGSSLTGDIRSSPSCSSFSFGCLEVGGLNPGTRYYMQVNGSIVSYSICTEFPAMTTISHTSSCSGITLSWSNIGTFTYEYEVHSNSGFTNMVNSGSTSNTSVFIGGLTYGVSYYYRVRAINGDCVSDWLNGGPGLLSGAGYPSNLYSSNISQTSFKANWSPGTCASTYSVSAYNDSHVRIKGPFTTTSTFYTFSDLPCDYYYFKVTSNPGGATATSSTFPINPSNPIATSPTNIQQTSFRANWNSTCNATSYYLYVYHNGALISGYPKSTSGTYYNVTGLGACKVYTYKVIAMNSSGSSNYSNTQTVETRPSNPSGLFEDGVTPYNFTAKWACVSCVTTSQSSDNYHVQLILDGSSWSELEQEAIDVDMCFYSFSSLQQNTTYKWRVRAKTQSGYSGWSYEIITTASSGGRVGGDVPFHIEDKEIDIKVFPNPAFNKVGFRLNSDYNSDEMGIIYTIIDQSGKQLQFGETSNEIPIDISMLPKGLYFMIYSIGGVSKTERLIKQ